MIQYLRESWEELRRVNWPSRDEVIQGTQTVLLFLVMFTTVLWIADTVFALLRKLAGL